MKEIAEKLKQKEVEMAAEKGPFDLFALFLREDASGKWDLVVAADWIDRDKPSALRYIANIIQRTLTEAELVKLSRIAIIDESNPALEALHRAVNVEHGVTEIRDRNFFDLQLKHVYLITSKRQKNESPNNSSKATASRAGARSKRHAL